MRITVVQGDLTEQRVDAVVNPTDPFLRHGGAVHRAIHQRGGPAIGTACAEQRARWVREGHPAKGLALGFCHLTTAGDLPARWVVHTAAPGPAASEDTLACCYQQALLAAAHVGARTIAFPALSTGRNRWPADRAARVAVGTVRRIPTRLREVRFVLPDTDVRAAFHRALARTPDDEIAARLGEQPDAAWRELFAQVDRLTEADLRVPWQASQEMEPGIFSMPFPRYGSAVRNILQQLHALRVIAPFDHAAWTRRGDYGSDLPARLARAPVADASRLATQFVRAERFGDGAIQAAIERGTFHAVLDRLRRWYEEER